MLRLHFITAVPTYRNYLTLVVHVQYVLLTGLMNLKLRSEETKLLKNSGETNLKQSGLNKESNDVTTPAGGSRAPNGSCSVRNKKKQQLLHTLRQ